MPIEKLERDTFKKGVKVFLITGSDDPRDDHHGQACIDWAFGVNLGV